MFGSSSEGASPDGTVGLVIRLIFSLALVLGLLLLIARFANRRFKARSGAAIQVVHRQHLNRGSSIAVVTIGTRVLVLGATEQQITLLTEVEPDEVGLDPDTMQPELDPERAIPHVRKGDSSRSNGALGGSILSLSTWRQTWAQLRPHGDADAPPYDGEDQQAS